MPIQFVGFVIVAALLIAGGVAASEMLPPDSPRAGALAYGSAIGAFLILSAGLFRFTVDDAYISLRYARHLATGYGLAFSRDKSLPVEGYTNFLWVVLEAPLFLLRLSDAGVLNAVKALGIAFGAGVILMTGRLAEAAGLSARAARLGSLFVAAVPYLAYWAVGGLETSAYLFFLVAALAQYLRETARDSHHARSACLFTLLALTRPEGAVVSAIVLGSALVGRRPHRARAAIGLALVALLYGAYFAWRYHYFGYLLPNTYYARSGDVGVTQLVWRALGMLPFIVYLLPWLAIAFLAAASGPPLVHRQGLLAAVFGGLFALTFAAKREWMPGFRYELPLVPLAAVWWAAALDRLIHAGSTTTAVPRRSARCVFLAAVGVCLVYPAISLRVNNMNTAELERAHIAIGRWMHRVAPDGAVAAWDMGAIPYFSDLPIVIDINEEGLLNPRTAHEGYDVDAVLAARPTFLVLPQPRGNPKTGIGSFYGKSAYRTDYEPVAVFAMTSDYLLFVHKRRDLTISSAALAEVRQLANRSLAEVGLPPQPQ